jgi:hypothetical protein
MLAIDPMLTNAIAARNEGRKDDALRHLLQVYGRVVEGDAIGAASDFITMFEWEQLAEVYPPARAALASARDDQVRRLLENDDQFSEGSARWPRSRFAVIVGMNKTLQEPHVTYTLFVQLAAQMPALARREASRALPAIVEAGDFKLAQQYLPDPMAWLGQLNQLACDLPLIAPPSTAPRLAAELSNFVGDVRLCAAVAQGLGRQAEAEALRDAAIAGIASEEMRLLAQRELADPGTIMREMTERQIAADRPAAPAAPTN